MPALVVPSEHEDGVLELDLDGKDEAQHLDREGSSIDIVPQEDVLSGLKRTSGIVVHDFDEVIELSVDIPYNRYGILNLDHVGLFLWVRAMLLKTCLAFFSSSE